MILKILFILIRFLINCFSFFITPVLNSIICVQFTKTYRFPFIQNILLDLFSLQLCLLLFLKTTKLCICSAWLRRTFAEIFFSSIDIINVSKIQQIYRYFTEKTWWIKQSLSLIIRVLGAILWLIFKCQN